jgi:predicted RNase H-like nuclease (RuvC/YqgF family)
MANPDYYRRQAMSSLTLAQLATNPETKRQLIELADEYLSRADSAAEQQLDAFIAKSNVGVSVLTR